MDYETAGGSEVLWMAGCWNGRGFWSILDSSGEIRAMLETCARRWIESEWSCELDT